MFLPETIIITTFIITALFLVKKGTTRKDVIIMNILLAIGLTTSAFFVLRQASIVSVFKIYFLYAALLFIYKYSERFHTTERISVLAMLAGVFIVLSLNSDVALFISFALILVSVYGFTVTRERPDMGAVTAVSTMLILLLMYKLAPAVVIMLAVLAVLTFPLKTRNSSLEALVTTLVAPILIFLCMKNLATSKDPYFLVNSLRVVGSALVILSPILLCSNKPTEKRMVKYGLFYVGNILFLLSMNTTGTFVLAVIYTLMIALIYDAKLSSFSIFNLAMMPPSPAFIIKLLFLYELSTRSHPAYQMIMIICSLAVMLHAAIDIYKIGVRRPLLLKIISITAIIVLLVYLEQFKGILNAVIGVFAG